MGLFDNANNNPNTSNTYSNTNNALPNAQQALNQLRNNPAEMVEKAGMHIPANMNDPQQIINHLIKTGQIGNNRVQQAMAVMRRMGLIK